MTRAELITSLRNIVNELSTDAGAFLSDTGNVLDFLADAAEIVVLDLVEFMPESFLGSEDISLTAGTSEYSLTSDWIQIYCILKNSNSEIPKPIPYLDNVADLYTKTYVGEKADDPECWYLKGRKIVFSPTPSKNSANYASAWIVKPESASMGENGPTMIPRHAHRLIVYMAAILVGTALGANTARFESLYNYRLKKVRDTIGVQVQNNPKFLNNSILDRLYVSSRDRAFYDTDPFFGR